MKTRVITTIVALPLLIFILLIGNNILIAGMLILSLVGMFEFYRAIDKKHNPLIAPCYFFTVIYYVLLFVIENFQLDAVTFLHVIPSLMIGCLFIITVIYYPKYNIVDVSLSFFGFIYVSVFFSYIYIISEISMGKLWVWIVFLSALGSDSVAYLVGKKWGSNKLAPLLSPKKTLEGAIGGAFGGMCLTLIFYLIWFTILDVAYSYLIPVCIISLISAIVSQFGDLAASSIKRYVGVKDYGSIFPGHGGVLDRFDSVLIITPFTYFIIMITTKFLS